MEATYPYLAQFMGLLLDEAQAKRLAGLGGESVRWHIFPLLPRSFTGGQPKQAVGGGLGRFAVGG